MNKPKRVLNCTTHHHACDCREYYTEKMRTALKVIQTWAKCDSLSTETRQTAMLAIEAKCKQALAE